MENQNNMDDNKTNNEEPQVFDVSFSVGKQKFSRRKFVEAAAITSAVATLAGCIPGASLGPIPLGPTFTSTPTATRTPTKIFTQIPTPIPSPTSTSTSTPVPDVIMLVNTQGTVFRTGPGEEYPGITSLSIGVPIHLNGRLYDDSWYRGVISIEHLPDLVDQSLSEVEGWIRADLLNTLEGDPSLLPVIDDFPPAPTELPNTPIPKGEDGIEYSYTDAYGNVQTYTLPCGAEVPEGSICTCNCVSTCSCVGYVAPSCSCDSYSNSCSCNLVSYWYPN